MKELLKTILNHSHSPYSGVKVASIAIDKDGYQYTGVNVENAAFPSSICAERAAMYSAISSGVKAGDISDIYIHSTIDGLKPCGACLQVMSELMSDDGRVHIVGSNDESYSLDELLHFTVKKESFGWK